MPRVAATAPKAASMSKLSNEIDNTPNRKSIIKNEITEHIGHDFPRNWLTVHAHRDHRGRVEVAPRATVLAAQRSALF